MTATWHRLFIGGLDDAEALAGPNPAGITSVISLCREEARAKAKEVNYLRFPAADTRPIPAGQFDAIIDALWENIRWGKVMIHSLAGASRAPIIAAAWMQAVGCKDIDMALAEIGRLRPIRPHPILLKSVKEML